MNKRVSLLLNVALAALLAGSAWGAETAPAASDKATSTAPAAATPASAPAAPPVAAPAATQAAAPTTAQTAAPAGAVKVGYVDLTRIASESAAGKAAKAELLARSGKLRAKLEAKQTQLEKEKKKIEAKLPTFTPQQREAEGKKFQKKVEEYQKLARSSEQEMQEAEEKVKTSIITSIREVAGDYGKRNGFAAVIVKEQMLYISDSVSTEDLTDKITKALDQKNPKQ